MRSSSLRVLGRPRAIGRHDACASVACLVLSFVGHSLLTLCRKHTLTSFLLRL